MIDELQSVLIEYACLERVIDGYSRTLAKLEESRKEVLDKLEKLKPSPEAPERYNIQRGEGVFLALPYR